MFLSCFDIWLGIKGFQTSPKSYNVCKLEASKIENVENGEYGNIITITELKLKRTEVAFWQLTEKYKSAISIFKPPEGIGAPEVGKQNFPLTLTAKQSYHMLHAQAKCKES